MSSRYFDNTEVESELKKAKGSRMPMPRQIRVRKEGNRYAIFMPAEVACDNQQEDPCAFEGWALVLKTWLDADVVLYWDPPADPSNQHYQRFLYRVIHFNESVGWFDIGKASRHHLEQSIVLKPDGDPKMPQGHFLVNVPGKRKAVERPPESKKLCDYAENELELLFFVNPDGLLRSVGIDEEAGMMRQIPVGVFKGEISNNSRVFPGAGGKVDLGAVDIGKGVWLFELKKMRGNNKVGAVSEILFYSHVIRDIQLGIFSFGERAGEAERLMSDAESVKGVILAHCLNGAIDNPVLFRLLNEAFQKREEQFGFVSYKMEGPELKCCTIY